ncbi:MmgE/PrpD family protein [Chloroflexota bacterium]
MDVIFDLAKTVVNARYEDLTPEVVEVAKKFIIDSIGVAIAGSSADGNAEIVDLIREWGGKEESSIMVYGFKVPSPEAAFVNSLLIHSPDFDDTDDRTATHTCVTALPAAMAIAEKMGSSGKDLITAFVLGVDVTCRLALASNLFHGWHNTTTVGVFGAAVAAGKIMGLDLDNMVNALGIAYSQASGNRQGRSDGALTKRLQPPFAAKAGVISALLAQRGISGAKNVFQGEWGFFRLYHDYSVEYEPDKWAEKLKDGLGTRFEVVNLGAKPYPSVRASHAPIGGAIAIATRYDIKPEDIEEVIIGTNERVISTAGGPFVIRTNPEVDAQFSIPYLVAVALTGKKVGLDDVREEVIRSPEMGELAAKVKVVVALEFKDSRSTMGPIKIKVRMKDGKEYSHREELAKGHPDNPMTGEELAGKFHDCIKRSAKPIPEKRAEQLLEVLSDLEKVDQMGKIISLTT